MMPLTRTAIVIPATTPVTIHFFHNVFAVSSKVVDIRISCYGRSPI